MTLAYHDGRLEPEEAGTISPVDAGFLFGDGLFETLRVDAGVARDIPAHLDRLAAGLARIELLLPEDRAALAAALAAVAAAAPWPVARLRLTVSRGTPAGGPTRRITAAPYAPPAPASYRQGVAAILAADLRLDSASPLAGLKSLSCQAQRLAAARAERAGAFEALLVNEHGRLVEGARSNLVVALADGLSTPPLAEGCLAGTVRRRLLEAGRVRERPLAPGDLARARGLYLTNSLIGILPVATLDGRPLPLEEDAGELPAWPNEKGGAP